MNEPEKPKDEKAELRHTLHALIVKWRKCKSPALRSTYEACARDLERVLAEL